jgi:hypothetical protein
MLFGRCDLVFEILKKSRLGDNHIEEDALAPNLVQIGQETAEKS